MESCLERAIGELRADADVDLADREIKVDRDTRDVPGSPPIMETIFAKIDEAAVFLADLTYVAERIGGKKAPNPNVCIEHGYALRVCLTTLTWFFGYDSRFRCGQPRAVAEWPRLRRRRSAIRAT
ncbi:MAG: hypothetical protein WDN46_04515 [Methylocella sp.]